MSMKIRNSPDSISSLNKFNKNNSKLSKTLQKVAGGQKINSAADGASEYGISEKMRVQIRALDQDTQNIQNGSTMLKIAYGGIEQIIEELRSLKELAINAANDSNTDADRATIQKEFDKRKDTIDDIATWTNYNTKALLDGTYSRLTTPEDLIGNMGSETVIEPTGIRPLNGLTIGQDGVYDVTGISGILTINAKNVELAGTTSNLSIVTSKDGNTNLWLGGLKVNGGYEGNSIIKFQGKNNKLIVGGSHADFVNEDDFNVLSGNSDAAAVINVGGGLTIRSSLNGYLHGGYFDVSQYGKAATIGSDYGEYSDANILIENFSLDINHSNSGNGAAIGSGENGSIGNIVIRNAEIMDMTTSSIDDDMTDSAQGYGSNGAFIGSGKSGSCGDIYIENTALVIDNQNSFGKSTDIDPDSMTTGTGAGIGSGGSGASAGNITLINEYLGSVNALLGAGIGSGAFGSTVGTITCSRCTDIHDINYNAQIDAGSLQKGDAIGNGYRSTSGGINNLDSINPNEGALTVHHGAKSNQRTHFYLNDMHCISLGISNTKVLTRPKANEAIGLVDRAITYALREATYVGSYLQRLEFTESNIVLSSENIQNAESTIRDADMAKEMTEYTKANVLSQASQSMLAQANQNLNGILSLLQ